jgi:hypothetical protein
VNRLGMMFARSLQDAIDVQVAFGRCGGSDVLGFVRHSHVLPSAVGIGIDGDAGDPHFTQSTDYANGNLAPIGDQDLTEHRCDCNKWAGLATTAVVLVKSDYLRNGS